MTKVVIIGSGPAAAAAVHALVKCDRCDIEIVDIGRRLEPDKVELLRNVADLRPERWPDHTLRELSRQPTVQSKGELPQKWLFGSDFPFHDEGQAAALTTTAGGNRLAVSGAFGGFSNAWGAQIMPYTRPTLDAWPVGYAAMEPHYRAILAHVPFSGAEDDYSDSLPLLGSVQPLPSLSPAASAVLRRYAKHRASVRRRGITIGQARLALDAARCIECGLCLTGCPYGLIYASSQTLDPLISSRRITYRDGMIALRVGEDAGGAWIEARNLRSNALEILRADKVMLACGGLGTTRVALNSLRRRTRTATLKESVQLVLPFVSVRRQPDPRTFSTFTLNQFNMLIEYGAPDLDLAQIHLYPYNPAFEHALPAPLRTPEAVRRAALRRVTAGLGYLPSWASPSIDVRLGDFRDGALPPMQLVSNQKPATRSALLKVIARLLSVAPALDLWPVLSSLRVSGPAKSYHFGGILPHVSGRPRENQLETDVIGRPAEWRNIHLIDASVFPSVAATTFTLTVMANAHRIASSVGEGL